MGLLFCFLGAISFGLLACVSKGAERRNANASGLVIAVCGWAALIMLIRSALLKSGPHMPPKAIAVAVACGVCAAVAYLAFQTSIRIGKVTVAWLMMNLSAGVPAVVSIWKYHEKLTTLKVAAFALVLVSIFFLFWGQKIEERAAESPRLSGD
jgi:drug/metabolite transporter (DMT)-like permease